MRRIVRPEQPISYSYNRKKWLEKFLIDGSHTWNNPIIKEPFLKSSFYKCAYCETKLFNHKTKENENTWMNIDHFKAKAIEKYRKLVLEWENFLPLCSACNSAKSNKDVCDDNNFTVLNPYNDNTQEHFYYDDGVLGGLTKKAIRTLNLINYERRELYNNTNGLRKSMHFQLNKLQSFDIESNDWSIIEEFKVKLKNYLKCGSNENEYCTYCATYITKKQDSIRLIDKVRQKNYIWEDSFLELLNECNNNSFELK